MYFKKLTIFDYVENAKTKQFLKLNCKNCKIYDFKNTKKDLIP